jgi:hypothetical protein
LVHKFDSDFTNKIFDSKPFVLKSLKFPLLIFIVIVDGICFDTDTSISEKSLDSPRSTSSPVSAQHRGTHTEHLETLGDEGPWQQFHLSKGDLAAIPFTGYQP